MRLYSLLLGILACLVACRPLAVVPQNQVTKPDTVKAVVVVDTVARVPKADTVAQLPPPKPINYDTVLLASMLRTRCYGLCPHYEVKAYASGRVVYVGHAYVDSMGWYEARVDSLRVLELLQQAEQKAYWQLADAYPTSGAGIVDFPLCVTFLRKGNQRKTIYNRNDAPKALLQYEQFFDEWWKGIAHWEKVNH